MYEAILKEPRLSSILRKIVLTLTHIYMVNQFRHSIHVAQLNQPKMTPVTGKPQTCAKSIFYAGTACDAGVARTLSYRDSLSSIVYFHIFVKGPILDP